MEEVNGYDDLEELGRGGFSIIYRARQVAFDREIALKVLTGVDFDTDAVQRFQRERLAVGALSWHPRVVTVYDAGMSAAGRPYIAMELMDHGSLLSLPWPMPWNEVLAIGIEVSDALEAAHRRGVLHRDIKPENVLRSSIGGQKLADFGIAKMLGGAQTATGMFTGTVSYAAPELFDGRPASPQSDVYSTGALLFALLAGQPAFRRASDESALAEVLRAAKDPVPDLRSTGVPEPVARLIERAMAKDPAARPASAAGFIEELWQVQDAAGLPRTDVYWPHAPQPGRSGASGSMGIPTPRHDPGMSPTPAVSAIAPPSFPSPALPHAQNVAPPPPPPAPRSPGPPPTPGAKKKIPVAAVIVVGVVVLLAAVAGGVVLLSGGGGKKKATDSPTTTAPKKTPTTAKPKVTLVGPAAGTKTTFTKGDVTVLTVAGPPVSKAVAADRKAATTSDRAAGGWSRGGFSLKGTGVTTLPADQTPACQIVGSGGSSSDWRAAMVVGNKVVALPTDPSTPGLAHAEATELGSGQPAWKRDDLTLPCQDNSLVAGGTILLRSGDTTHPGIAALDAATGKTAWTLTLDHGGAPVVLVPSDADHGLLLLRSASADKPVVLQVRMLDGHVVWADPAPTPTSMCDAVFLAKTVQVAGCAGEVLTYDAAKGTVKSTVNTGGKGFARFVSDGRTQALDITRSFGSDGHGQVASFGPTGAAQWSSNIPGTIRAYAIGPNSLLQVLTQPRGGNALYLVSVDLKDGSLTSKATSLTMHTDPAKPDNGATGLFRMADGLRLGLVVVDFTPGTTAAKSTLTPGAPAPPINLHVNPEGIPPFLAADGKLYLSAP